MLGLVASTLDDSLINHVTYTWLPLVGTAPPTFPSVAKAGQAPFTLWDHRSRWAVFAFPQSHVKPGSPENSKREHQFSYTAV